MCFNSLRINYSTLRLRFIAKSQLPSAPLSLVFALSHTPYQELDGVSETEFKTASVDLTDEAAVQVRSRGFDVPRGESVYLLAEEAFQDDRFLPMQDFFKGIDDKSLDHVVCEPLAAGQC